MLRSIGAACSEGFWQQLMLAKQYMPDDQIARTYSKEGLPEVHEFKKDMIDPGISVRVQMGTGLSRSRAARQDQLMNLWQQGLIRDPDLLVKLLDVPVSPLDPSDAFDMRLARNENLDMAKGIPVKPNSWDNHTVHITEHNNYRKTQEFLMLSDKEKSMFEAHVQFHMALQQQDLKQQIQLQQMQMQIAQASAQGLQAGGGAQQQADAQDQTAQDLQGGSQGGGGASAQAPGGAPTSTIPGS